MHSDHALRSDITKRYHNYIIRRSIISCMFYLPIKGQGNRIGPVCLCVSASCDVGALATAEVMKPYSFSRIKPRPTNQSTHVQADEINTFFHSKVPYITTICD